jgi:hypothetical protein
LCGVGRGVHPRCVSVRIPFIDPKGGEGLGDKEGSEEEKEVTPASILRRGRGHSLPT